MNKGKKILYFLFTITLFSLFSESTFAQRRGRRRGGWRGRRPYYGRRYRRYGRYPYYRRGWYGPGFGIGFGVGPGYRYGGYGSGFSIGFGF